MSKTPKDDPDSPHNQTMRKSDAEPEGPANPGKVPDAVKPDSLSAKLPAESAQTPKDNSAAALDQPPGESVFEKAEQARLAGVWDAVLYGQPNENLDPLIDESKKEPDIKKGLELIKLDIDVVSAEIKGERTELWATVTNELSALKDGSERHSTALGTYNSLLLEKGSAAIGPAEETTFEGCLQALGGLALVGGFIALIIVLVRRGLGTAFALTIGQYRFWALGLFALIILSYGLFFWLRRRRSKKTELQQQARKQEIETWVSSDQVSEAKQLVDSANDQLEGLKAAVVRAVLQKVINNKFRSVINARSCPSYSTHLQITSSRGLAEVFDPKSAIDTTARNSLLFMLENMPGGSIGIAGPRGAGKSTLLRLFCGPKRILTPFKKGKVLAALVSAPVAYQARDFILYLFSTVCQNALEAEGEDYPRPSLDQPTVTPPPFSIAPFVDLIEPLPKLSIYLGTILVILALLLGVVLTLAPSTSKEKEAGGSSANTNSQTMSSMATPANPSSSPTTSAQPSPTPAVSPATQTSQGDRFIGDFLRTMEISPGSLLLSGLLTIGFGMVCAALVRENPFRTLGSSLLGMVRVLPPINSWIEEIAKRRSARNETAAELPKPSEPTPAPRTLKSEAREWLKRIKFQQSYTSGWTGALKLPIGLEGGVNNAVTLAENQLSLPEISHAFTKFVELASQTYQVIIGIDELDKLEADKDAAHLFLNDIKSVFGLENCFYLVSVSENAMSSFERRGMPFRDVFDSSFDDIIYVDYLNFKSAQSLLERKVIGRPIPFFGLSYSLSAGLARDLIRNFRAVIAIRHSNQGSDDLESICKAIVHSDLKAKIRATTVSVKQLDLETEIDVFLEKLYKLERAVPNESALFEASLELVKGNRPASDPNNDTKRQSDREKLFDQAEELATYVFFAVTVMEFFNNGLTETSLTEPKPGGALDDLAKARQVLAVNPNTTRSILSTFREAHGLNGLRVWPSPVAPPAENKAADQATAPSPSQQRSDKEK